MDGWIHMDGKGFGDYVEDSYKLQVGRTYLTTEAVELRATYGSLFREFMQGAWERAGLPETVLTLNPMVPVTVTWRKQTDSGPWYRLEVLGQVGRVEGWVAATELQSLIEINESIQ